MNAKHTPTPWHLVNNIHIHDRKTEYLPSGARTGNTPNSIAITDSPNAEANAKHIVNCVNMHDELIEALKWAYEYIELTIELDGPESVDAESTEKTLDKVRQALLKEDRRIYGKKS